MRSYIYLDKTLDCLGYCRYQYGTVQGSHSFTTGSSEYQATAIEKALIKFRGESYAASNCLLGTCSELPNQWTSMIRYVESLHNIATRQTATYSVASGESFQFASTHSHRCAQTFYFFK